MKRTGRIAQLTLIAGLLLAWSAAVSAQDIKYNFAEGTDFSKYKTYKWVKVPNAEYPNSILDGQIMQAIDTQLAAKGLTKTEDNPDLYVIYQAAVNQEKQWNSYSSGGDMLGLGPLGWLGRHVDDNYDQFDDQYRLDQLRHLRRRD